jgi:hypothetical protein
VKQAQFAFDPGMHELGHRTTPSVNRLRFFGGPFFPERTERRVFLFPLDRPSVFLIRATTLGPQRIAAHSSAHAWYL